MKKFDLLMFVLLAGSAIAPAPASADVLLNTITGSFQPDTGVYRKPKSERSGDEVRPRWRANL